MEPLTAQELQVAELAACGLSNKEIAQRLYMSRPRGVPNSPGLPSASAHLAGTRAENPRGYLYMIATNLVADHWRKAGRERRAMAALTAGAERAR